MKRPIRTLYKRKGKESGGNEWVCIHCDLTFDNPSLLNLHTLTHAAEDVGLEEIRRLAGEITENGTAANGEVNPVNSETTGKDMTLSTLFHMSFLGHYRLPMAILPALPHSYTHLSSTSP